MNQSLSLITDKHNIEINKILKNFEEYLLTINTGIITPNLIDHIHVNISPKKVSIKHIATITVQRSMILINPWDKANLKFIEKAILDSSSNFFPRSNGEHIFVKIPPLTKEDRLSIFKELKAHSEKVKVFVRQSRRNYNNLIKLHIKKHKLSSNLDRVYLNIIQKQTDNQIKKIDEYVSKKKETIMNV